ncbi:hypothetical protein HGM15179_014428 [Zosterops borbonicus]|uniref:Uncharacterized protein n=1 Tax=Zosterops borbonicus TaxID=364589 RepID=A0A8K1G731_9PASS|nr:hypothetical protein HGM15179_014428 [Zosterops borbonicus]
MQEPRGQGRALRGTPLIPSPLPSSSKGQALSEHLVGAMGISEMEEEEWESDMDHEFSQQGNVRRYQEVSEWEESLDQELSQGSVELGELSVWDEESRSCPREKPFATKTFPAGKNAWSKGCAREKSVPPQNHLTGRTLLA